MLIAHKGRTMSRSRLAIAALAVVAVAAGGVAAGMYSSTRGPAAATETTVATPPPTTAGAPASPVSTTGPAGASAGQTTTTGPRAAATQISAGKISDPAKAAAHLFDAWQTIDHESALEFASAAAVRTMFAIDTYPRPRFSGCEPGGGGFDCRYRYANANGILLLDLRVTGGASAGYRVVSVTTPLRFSDPASSAKHLLDSWRAGDRAAALGAASPDAVDTMWRVADRAHPPKPGKCVLDAADHSYDCFDAIPSGSLAMRLTGGASAGWVVTSVAPVVD
jgi:hypothetical protein